MKTKNYKLFFCLFLCGIVFLACFFVMPVTVKADTTSPAIAIIEGKTITKKEKAYEYNENGQEITLGIVNYDFQEGDTVEYFYSKQGTGNIVYKFLASVDDKDEENNTIENPYREMTKNFFAEARSGVYLIKAVVLHTNDNQKEYVFPSQLKITINAMSSSNLKGKIEVNNSGVFSGEYATYKCKVQLLKNEEEVNISNYQIDWYYTLNGKDHFCGNGESIEWTPNQDGDYVIKANINLGINNEILSASGDLGHVSKNYSFYAIIALVSLGVALTVVVIITTVRKVKKERVW